MFGKIYNHLVAPRMALLAARSAASRLGLRVFEVQGSNMAPTIAAGDIDWYRPWTSESPSARSAIVAVRSDLLGDGLVPSRLIAIAGDEVEL